MTLKRRDILAERTRLAQRREMLRQVRSSWDDLWGGLAQAWSLDWAAREITLPLERNDV